MKDRCVVVAVLDIYNKTVVQMAPVPPTTAYASSINRFDGKVLDGVEGQTESGYYLFDPATGKASEKPIVGCQGTPFWSYQPK